MLTEWTLLTEWTEMTELTLWIGKLKTETETMTETKTERQGAASCPLNRIQVIINDRCIIYKNTVYKYNLIILLGNYRVSD